MSEIKSKRNSIDDFLEPEVKEEALQVYIDAKLKEQVGDLLKKEKRTFKDLITASFKLYLAERTNVPKTKKG